MNSRLTLPIAHVRGLLRNSVCLVAAAMTLGTCAQPSGEATAPGFPPRVVPSPPAPPPANATIAFVSTRDGDAYIYLATADGSSIGRLARGENPAWSPDGKRIAFRRLSRVAPGSIAVIHADGSNEVDLRTDGSYPAWSPDGSSIAFSKPPAGDGGIYVMKADGSGVSRLIRHDFESPELGSVLHSLAWAPDGRHIAFVRSNFDEPWEIYLMNADGSNPRALLGQRFAQASPSWSPDGSLIAFEALGALGIVPASGSAIRWLGRANSFDPDWSPDGRTLLLSLKRVFVLSVDTEVERQLIPEAVHPVLPDYSDYQAVWSRVKK